MIFSGNMNNDTKERVLKAAQLSGCKIEIGKPSDRLSFVNRDKYFGLYRQDYDISLFWAEYRKLEI